MDPTDLAYAGAARQAELLRAGEVSSSELTELYLKRIEAIDPQLNSYRDVFADSARAEAKAADERRSKGEDAPLLGVPVSVKDTIDVAGDVTRFGTSAYDRPASQDSELVKRLRGAGVVILGKTNLPELAICGFTESKTNGITRNPWNPAHTPGGSSGGAGAAAAAGLCAASHGSDGAGSVRIPSACCGLFGLKPRLHRLPFAPVGHWYDLSVNGFLTRTVLDNALLLDAAGAGGPTERPAPEPLARTLAEAARTAPDKLRIALSTKAIRAVAPPKVTDDVKLAVSDAGEVLRSLGHEVTEREPSYGTLGNRFTPRYLRGICEDVKSVPNPGRLEGRTRGFGRLGGLIARGQVERARRGASKDVARVTESLQGVDVLVQPVMGSLPIEVGRWEGKGALRTLIGMSVAYPFAGVWNHLDRPAASVPMGWDDASGLPRAVMLVGIGCEEDTLVSLAAQIESERPWADRRPPVG